MPENRSHWPWAAAESDCTSSRVGEDGSGRLLAGAYTPPISKNTGLLGVCISLNSVSNASSPRLRGAASLSTSGLSFSPWSQWFPPTGGAGGSRKPAPCTSGSGSARRRRRWRWPGLVLAPARAASAGARELPAGREIPGYVWRWRWPRGCRRAPSARAASGRRALCLRPAPRGEACAALAPGGQAGSGADPTAGARGPA